MYKYALNLLYENVRLQSYGRCGDFALALQGNSLRALCTKSLDIEVECRRFRGQDEDYQDSDSDWYLDQFCKCWEDKDSCCEVLARITASFESLQPFRLSMKCECPLATRAILSSIGRQRLQDVSFAIRCLSHSHTDYIAHSLSLSHFLTRAGPQLRYFCTKTVSASETQVGVILNIGLAPYPELKNLCWMSSTLWELLGTPALQTPHLKHLQVVACASDDTVVEATMFDIDPPDIARRFPQDIERLDISVPHSAGRLERSCLQILVADALAATSIFPALTQMLVKYNDAEQLSLLSDLTSTCRRRNIDVRFQQVSTTALWSQSPPWPCQIGSSV